MQALGRRVDAAVADAALRRVPHLVQPVVPRMAFVVTASCPRRRSAGEGDVIGAVRDAKRLCVVAAAVTRGRVRKREPLIEGDAVCGMRKRVCAVPRCVVMATKRARDACSGVEEGLTTARAVRVRGVGEAGGMPTSHLEDGDGILSGSGAP